MHERAEFRWGRGITNRQAKYRAALQREAGEKYTGNGMTALRRDAGVSRVSGPKLEQCSQSLGHCTLVTSAQRRHPSSDERFAVCEQEVVEVEVEQLAKRLAQPSSHRCRVIAHKEPGHEREPSAARPGDAVSEGQRAVASDADVQCGVVRADDSQLVCGDPRRQLLTELEALNVRAALELV